MIFSELFFRVVKEEIDDSKVISFYGRCLLCGKDIKTYTQKKRRTILSLVNTMIVMEEDEIDVELKKCEKKRGGKKSGAKGRKERHQLFERWKNCGGATSENDSYPTAGETFEGLML